jgi:hypothetical protein
MNYRTHEKNIMDNKLLREKIRLVWTIILLAILVVFLLTGCKTKTVLVPVEKVKIEYRERLRVDSIYNRDTIQIYKKNDTIYYEKIRWRERFKIDTVSVVRVDSIPYKVEVVKEVNKLTKWQKLRLSTLNILVLIIAAYLFIKIKLS